MKKILLLLLIVFSLISCSDDDDEIKERKSDYNKIDWYKANDIEDVGIVYMYDYEKNDIPYLYSHPLGETPGSCPTCYYNERYNNERDSIFFNVRGDHIGLKFNEDNIICYTYDYTDEFIEHKTTLQFNEEKLITGMDYIRISRNRINGQYGNYEYFVNGRRRAIYTHDVNGNLVDIKMYESFDSNSTDWEPYRNHYNFSYFDHPLPTFKVASWIPAIQDEIMLVIFNMGYRLSSSGVKDFTHQTVSDRYYDKEPHSLSLSLFDNYPKRFRYDIEHFNELNEPVERLNYTIGYVGK